MKLKFETQRQTFLEREGPLAKTELAQLNAQGTDPVYALQSWLKRLTSVV